MLNLLAKAGLSICDRRLEADTLWEYVRGFIQERDGDFAFIVPMVLGKGERLNFTDISAQDIDAALGILRQHRPISKLEKIFFQSASSR